MDFILKTPLKYALKGDEALGYKISGKAPNAKVRNQLIVIKQTFFQALANIRKNSPAQEEQTSEEGVMTGDQVMMLLYVSGIDMVAFQNTVRDLFTHGQLLKIDNEVVLGAHLLDQLELDEFERLTGEYLANFLLPSLMPQ